MYGCLAGAPVFLEMKEGLASQKKELLQALTLGFQPFLIPDGEKGALIEVYGRLPVSDSTGGGCGRFKFRHIESEWGQLPNMAMTSNSLTARSYLGARRR